MAPWLAAGQGGLSNLSYMMGVGPQGQSNVAPQMQTGYNPTGQPQGPVAGVGAQQPVLNGSQVGAGQIGAAQPAPVSAAGSAFTNPNGVGPISAAPTVAGVMNTPYSPNGTTAQPASGGGMVTGAGQMPTDPNAAPGVNPAIGGYGSLMTPYGQTFQAPTDITEQNDPGYQARLALGTDALQHSAAARGNVLTGGTAKALDTYAQDYASNEYGNVYNRALNTFGTNYNVYNQNQANQFNRLAALSGVGQTAASQLATAGQNASNNVTSNLLGTAAQIGQQTNNAAAATASGYAAQGNLWGSALSGTANNFGNLFALQQQQKPYNTSGLIQSGAVPTNSLNSYMYEPTQQPY